MPHSKVNIVLVLVELASAEVTAMEDGVSQPEGRGHMMFAVP